MIVIRATIATTVDIAPTVYSSVKAAEDAIADVVRDALAEIGNVRTGVSVSVATASIPELSTY